MSDKKSPQELQQLRQAFSLLGGISVRDDKGLPRLIYLEKGKEKVARRAIAQLLASEGPLDGLLRHMLAGLFDRDFFLHPYPGADGALKFPQEREIRFSKASRRSIDRNRRLFIGFELWKKMGRPKEPPARSVQAKACAALAEIYDLDVSTIGKAYRYLLRTKWVD
jgi:hypothetical protein